MFYGPLVHQFGLDTVYTKMRLRDLALRTGGEPSQLTRRHKQVLKKVHGGNGSAPFRTLEEEIAIINDLIQRSFKGGKRTNVARIGDPDIGYIGRVKKNPDLAAFFPAFTVVHPEPAFKHTLMIPVYGEQKMDVGLVALHLYGPMSLLDGQTRLQGAFHYASATGSEWILEEEVAVCVIPGIPIEKAKQIFVTVNSTPVPVSFDDLVEKDAINRAFTLTRYVIQECNLTRNGRSIVRGKLASEVASEEHGQPENADEDKHGKIRQKAVYQFIMQALLGSQGEAKNADYLLEKDNIDHQKEILATILDRAEKALGPDRWGDTSQLLIGGYGLATIGRVYHDTEQKLQPISPSEAFSRIGQMSWGVNDERWLAIGVTAASLDRKTNKRVIRNKLTSFDMIRRVVEIICSDQWQHYKKPVRSVKV